MQGVAVKKAFIMGFEVQQGFHTILPPPAVASGNPRHGFDTEPLKIADNQGDQACLLGQLFLLVTA